MQSTVENGRLILAPQGRVDSTNAAEFEKEAMAAVSANLGLEIALDAQNLEYISSAGLRVLMKLRKLAKKAFPVENVSPEVYDIFEVTGFTELLDVKKRLREVSVEGCELIGSGGFGRVYRIDPETIVKVYSSGLTLDMVRHERDTAQKAFLAGVPTAISYDVVRSGDSYGVVFELLNARTVAQIMPYLYLPKSTLPEEERRRLLGFRLEDGPRMWHAMCGAYFGTDDPAEIERITAATMPVAQLMSSYQGTRRCGYDLDYMNRVSIVGIRQRLLPLIRSAKPLDW